MTEKGSADMTEKGNEKDGLGCRNADSAWQPWAFHGRVRGCRR